MMASKRTFHEDENQGNDDKDLHDRAKRRHGDSQQDEAMNSFLKLFETAARKVMKEMIPSMLEHFISFRSSPNQYQGATSGHKALELCFVNSLPSRIFTQAKLQAEGGGPLLIELRYAASKQRVVTEEYSTVKVQICVLGGDFGDEDWTTHEFNARILKPRNGRGPLLTKGQTIVKLIEGVGYIDMNLVFSDNSCWTTDKRFRLGLIILDSSPTGADIREGKSQPFKVMDKRGESYQKSKRPSLNDEIWRLDKMGKVGKLNQQLSDNGIKTVKDLLRLNTTGSLREKFGNFKTLEKSIAHAKTCEEVDGGERYVYHYHATEQGIPVSLVFNCIYEVVEVIFNGQHYPLQYPDLVGEWKSLVEGLKQEAYNNLQDLKRIEPTTDDLVMKILTDTQVAPNVAPEQSFQQLVPTLGPSETWASTSTSTMIDQMTLNLSGGQVVPEEAYIDGGNEWDIDPFENYIVPNKWVQNPNSFTYGDRATSSNHSSFPNSTLSKGRSKTVWHKTLIVLKWVMPHVTKWKAKIFRCHR
ncbi:hypothetical protein Fmac_006911 [Flemingia macrophylla]|uniref:Uncharacterized protein n=1 Tax=Flemingia macrophylla TaxID=520843 RepID=A0ABD1NBY3_9FABA